MSRGRDDAGGFTLIETVASMAVFTIVATALLIGLLTAVRRSEQANFTLIATELARSKLAAAGVDFPLAAGVASGSYQNGFSWRAEVAPLPRQPQAGVTFFDVRVTIAENVRGRVLAMQSIETDR